MMNTATFGNINLERNVPPVFGFRGRQPYTQFGFQVVLSNVTG